MVTLTPYTGVLGYINAAHLLRRATFKPNKARINEFAAYTVTQAMTALFAPLTLQVPEPVHHDTGQPVMQTFLNPTLNGYVLEDSVITGWYIREAIHSNTIQLKSAFWLHSMFVVNASSGAGSLAFFDYLQLLIYYSDKSLKVLAKDISRNSMMSVYLNNNLNTNLAPNENYAREFLELFTILKGPQDGAGSYTNYTEHDVQMAAKVLTGFKNIPDSQRSSYWNNDSHVPLNAKTFSDHDTTDKTFSSKFGGQTITGATSAQGMDAELDAFIDMVFNQQATALNFARRMYRNYVKSTITPEIETGVIIPLATHLMTNDYNISSALQLLLSSKHFYDAEDKTQYDQIFGAKVKSPLELFLLMYSQFEITIPHPTNNAIHNFWLFRNMRGYMYDIGMSIFAPSSVVGYIPLYQEPFDNLWINTAVLGSRYNQPFDSLLEGYNSNGETTQLNLVWFVRYSGNFSNPANATILITDMYDLLLSVVPTGIRHTYFTQSLLGGLSTISWQNEWNNYINTNNPTAVKIALNRLVTAIVKSVEYQVF
jgi:uncharacterized protein (DUF1800 family)